LNFFHSNAVVLSLLLSAWVTLALKVFSPCIEHGYRIFVADGLKVAKEGKKMPAVKCLHQESVNNSKAEYIMGHSFQVVAMLATAATGQVFAIPLLARICEGLMWDRSSQKPSLLDKLANMFIDVVALAKVPALLVADAYYASRKVIEPLLDNGHQLISRVRKNAVAYELPCTPTQKNADVQESMAIRSDSPIFLKPGRASLRRTAPFMTRTRSLSSIAPSTCSGDPLEGSFVLSSLSTPREASSF
jgi:hypothetical protein